MEIRRAASGLDGIGASSFYGIRFEVLHVCHVSFWMRRFVAMIISSCALESWELELCS